MIYVRIIEPHFITTLQFTDDRRGEAVAALINAGRRAEVTSAQLLKRAQTDRSKAE